MIDTLDIIDYDRITKITDDVITGKATIARLDRQEERGRCKGGRTNVEASLVLGRNRQANREKYAALSDSDIAQIQENLLRSYAKWRNVWLHEEDIASNASRPLPCGSESRVYLSANGDHVIKVTNYLAAGVLPEEFLDNRISLHNHLFPDTAYELLGFLDTGGSFSNFHFVLKQPFIQGKMLADETSPTKSEYNRNRLQDYMKTHFDLDGAYTCYTNDNYVVGDVHLGNVLEDKDGQFFFIDTIPELNTKDLGYFGGDRFYGDGSVVYF
jgi:hypothetical protein